MNTEKTTKRYIEEIDSTKISNNEIGILHNFTDGAYVKLLGDNIKKYEVSFYNNDNNKLIYRTKITPGYWSKTNLKYFINWRTEIKNDEGIIIFNNILNLKNKRVYIAISSSALGDSIASIGYAEEFRKKHKCKVIVSTFNNSLFENQYPELEFITPGEIVKDIYAKYKVGYFHNKNLEPVQCNTIPLQKAITNILGLEYKEIMSKINFKKKERIIEGKYITIAPHSTAKIKYWNNPSGWQETIKFLIDNGYKVINVSREGCNFKNVENLEDYSLENIMNTIHYSDFFIGLSSGISWLSWALKKKVIMIANFTEEGHEFKENCIKLTNKTVCNGCWNKKDHIFDKNDWNWCPIYKNTKREFECNKAITSSNVIDAIAQIKEI